MFDGAEVYLELVQESLPEKWNAQWANMADDEWAEIEVGNSRGYLVGLVIVDAKGECETFVMREVHSFSYYDPDDWEEIQVAKDVELSADVIWQLVEAIDNERNDRS